MESRTPQHTVVGFFDTLVAAGEAVAAVARAGVVPSALELLDRHCLTAVNDWKNLGLEADSAAILLARLDAPGPAGDGEADAVLACFEGSGATWAAGCSTDPDEADALFAARRLAYPAWRDWGRCSPRTSAYPSSRCRRCWPGSRRSASAVRRADRQHRARR